MEISGLLSPVAALAYLGTGGAALVAAVRAPRHWRKAAVPNWIAVLVAFVALAAWRLGNGEERVQDRVRGWTRAVGIYDDRHTFQVPVTLGAVLAIAGLIWLANRSSRAGNSGRALSFAVIMLLFTAVRATSLHAVDAFLYQSIGPVHVNYVIDLGLTALVAALALADWRNVPERRSQRSSSRGRSSGGGASGHRPSGHGSSARRSSGQRSRRSSRDGEAG